MKKFASCLNVETLNKFVIGVGWLCSNVACMYANLLFNINFGSIYMCFSTQAFYHHFHVCMYRMNRVHIIK